MPQETDACAENVNGDNRNYPNNSTAYTVKEGGQKLEVETQYFKVRMQHA